MARYADEAGAALDAAEARALLGAAGVQVAGPADQEAVVAAVLAPDERHVRVEVVAEPSPDTSTGMGAWHVNAADEAHTVLSGTGVMQFVTPQGVVSVVVEAGDVVVVRGAEHRYRPLTAQAWAIRHSGGPDADLGARETGRPSGGWPDLAV